MKSLILAIAMGLTLTVTANAQSKSDDDIIGPFPAIGSLEEKIDIDTLLMFQKSRTKEQCEIAEMESDAGLVSFYGNLLSSEELKVARKQLRWVTVKAGAYIVLYKKKFNRPRPYLSHPEIKPCIDLESSKAYPSGHATLARVYGRVLAEMFPERAELFLKHSDEISLNRVIGGVHHPSDIAAGKVLGDAIADQYLSGKDD